MYFSSCLPEQEDKQQGYWCFTVSLYKSLGYHCSNYSLSQTYNIGKEQTVMLHQHLIALNNGIFLIFQILDTIGQLNGKSSSTWSPKVSISTLMYSSYGVG